MAGSVGLYPVGSSARGAGEIRKRQPGTTHRLLLVLSDGFPQDDGYEGRYSEADARKALEELRPDGVGCPCLSIGTATDATLAELSPRMDEPS